MNKSILQDYIDACELIKETEQDIKKLNKRKTVMQTSVRGSNPEFPYQPQNFRIQGTSFTVKDDNRLRREEKLLEERKEAAERIKEQVEKWMLTIPLRMQRIIRHRYFEGLSWEETAAMMGRKATGEGLRKEIDRFFKEN